MKLKDKIIKWGTYLFISFITFLIILTFGMPNFMPSIKKSDSFVAAQVGDEKVTWREIKAISKQLQQMYFPDGKVPPGSANFLDSMAIEQAINMKLFILLSKESGFYPTLATRDLFVLKYLNEYFPKYNTENGFDFKSFRAEVQDPRNISDQAIFDDAIRQYALMRNENLFRSVYTSTKNEEADQFLLNNTQISYRILILNNEAKNKIIQKRAAISEKDILDKFQKDFLSKNPKDKLTKVKREGIIQTLLNERRANIEKELISEIAEKSKSYSLDQLQKLYGGEIKELSNISLNTNLSEVWPDAPGNLSLLTDDKEFLSRLFDIPLNETIGPINKGEAIFFYRILERKIPEETFLESPVGENPTGPTINHYEIMYGEMMNILRKQNNIARGMGN